MIWTIYQNRNYFQQVADIQIETQNNSKISKKLKNLEYYDVVLRKLSESLVYLPTAKPKIVEFNCDTENVTKNGVNKICKFESSKSEVISVLIKIL